MSIIEFTLKKDDVSSDTPAHSGVASKDTDCQLHTNYEGHKKLKHSDHVRRNPTD
jgi:hypothetical protein